MQVAALLQFLRSLAPALEAAGSGQAARDLEEACAGLEPFRGLGVAAFTTFLSRADEYRRTGSVKVPGSADAAAEKLLAAISRLTAALENPLEHDLSAAQSGVAVALEPVAQKAGLKGTLSADPQWAAAQVARATVAPHVRTIYDLAARIIAPDVYRDEPIRDAIAGLGAALDKDFLKAIGAEFGVSVTARSTAAKVVSDVLTKLTGHRPPKGRAKASAKTPAVDPAIVELNALRLSQLIARSVSPDGINEAEIDEELARLKELSKPVLAEVATRAGIDGVKPRDAASAILQRVHNRLTAARRARQRAEV